jgi:hypothetical protein
LREADKAGCGRGRSARAGGHECPNPSLPNRPRVAPAG